MKRNKIAVIGLGNRLLADEGVGLHALELLRKRLKKSRIEDIDLIEAGTLGMNLLHQLEEREKIIFIDAGKCGSNPGEYKRFNPHEVISRKKLQNYSLHEFDLLEFLEFADKLGMTKCTEIVVYCIRPADMGFSENLSTDVQKNLPHLIRDISNEVLHKMAPPSGPSSSH